MYIEVYDIAKACGPLVSMVDERYSREVQTLILPLQGYNSIL